MRSCFCVIQLMQITPYHRLRGSASTVLTATGQVNGMGDGEFWPLTESKPMTQLQQNSAKLIMSAGGHPKPNLVQIHPLGASGHMGEILRFVPFFIYLFIPFFWDWRTGQTGWWIFTRDSSLDVKSRKDVPFRALNDVPLNFGVKLPKNSNFGGVNRTSKPKRQKISNPYNLKTTYPIMTKF